MYGALDISVSGLVAQRTRMQTIAGNIANADSILDPAGDPNAYRRRIAHFAPGDPSSTTSHGRGQGVHVSAITLDDSPFRRVHDPDNPFAFPDGHPDAGYVLYPNIDPTIEQINGLEAARAYEANIAAAEATKSMMSQALRLLA
ncbi:MAG: flagellar basal body rod protein FlgC [Phycisphaerales bacterium]|nr:MAG: flagellar basal body rod protein FlgC [Phycisphaerales bacterium]